MQPQRRRKKRATHTGALRTVEVTRGRNGYGFTISGQNPCILSCIVSGSPADRAGLKTGDHLIAVNGQNVSKCTHDDVVRLIGSSRGLLLLQIAEHSNSSDSSDEEYHKSKSKYPPNRARLRQNGHSRIERVVADVHAGLAGRYTANTRDNVVHSKKGSGQAKTRSRSPLKEWSSFGVNTDRHGAQHNSKSNGPAKTHSSGLYGGEAAAAKPRKKNPAHQQAGSSASHALYRANKHASTSQADHSRERPHRSHSQPAPARRVALANDSAEYPQGLPPVFTAQELSNILYPSLQPHLDADAQQGAVGGEPEPDIRAVVGYIGSIEMPSDTNMASGRLTSIRSAVRRLRVEQKIHTLVLMEVHDDSVRLLSNGGHVMATYPAEKVAFSGVCPDDKRFFGIVTVHSASSDEVSCDDGSLDDAVSSSSCHVFMVDPDLRSHSMHVNRARSLGFQCSVDPETHSCLEFPRSATPILRSVSRLYRNRPGGLCDAAEISRGGGGQVFADPNFAPQRSTSNSSTNSDSGLGFGRDDAVYVVDMPPQLYPHPQYQQQQAHQQHRWQGHRAEPQPSVQQQPYHHPHHPGARGFPGVGSSFHSYHNSVDYSTSSNDTSVSSHNLSDQLNVSALNQSQQSTSSPPGHSQPPGWDKLTLRVRPDPVVPSSGCIAPQQNAGLDANVCVNIDALQSQNSADIIRRGVHKILQRRQQSGSDADSVHSNDSSQMPPPRQAPPLPSRKPPALPPKPSRNNSQSHDNSTTMHSFESSDRSGLLNASRLYDKPATNKGESQKQTDKSNADESRFVTQAGSTAHRLSPRAFPVTSQPVAAVPNRPNIGKRSVPVPIPQVPEGETPAQERQPPPLVPKPSAQFTSTNPHKNSSKPSLNSSILPSGESSENQKNGPDIEEQFKSSRNVNFKAPDIHDPRRYSEGFALLKQKLSSWEQGSQDDSRLSKLGSFRLLSKSKKKQPLSNSHESLVASEAESTKQRLANANSIAGLTPKPEPENIGCAASWAVGFERLLKDKAGLATFTEFLKKEFSEENIVFWMICEEFKKLTDPAQLKEQAQEIYDKHLSKRASDPVNIDSEARNAAEKALESPSADMFQQAQQQIFQLMKQDSYVRFLKSELYRSCVVAEMEGKPLPYSGEAPQPTQTQAQPAEKPDKKTLKKSKSSSGTEEGEEKRRRSILPWNRIKSGKRVQKMNTEPDLRKASHNKDDGKGGRVSLASTDLNTLSSHVTPPSQIAEDVKNECEEEEDKENVAENAGENVQFCRVILPDGATTVIYATVGQTIRTALLKLCEKRTLTIAGVDVFELGSDKALDLSQDVSSLGNKEIKLEKRILFRLDLPNRKSIGVKAKPSRSIRDVFRPILHKYGFQLDRMVVHISGVGEALNTEDTVASLDSERVQVQTIEDFSEWGGYDRGHRGHPQPPLRASSAPPTSDMLSDITSRVFEDLLEGPQVVATHQFDELGVLDPDQKQNRKSKSEESRNSSLFGFMRRNSIGKKEDHKLPSQRNVPSTIKNRSLHDKEDEKFFELLSRVQGQRLDDQRGLSSQHLELPDFLKRDNLDVAHNVSTQNASYDTNVEQSQTNDYGFHGQPSPVIQSNDISDYYRNEHNKDDLVRDKNERSLFEDWDVTPNTSAFVAIPQYDCWPNQQGDGAIWHGQEQAWSNMSLSDQQLVFTDQSFTQASMIPGHEQAECYFGSPHDPSRNNHLADYNDPRLMQKSLKDIGFDYSYSEHDRNTSEQFSDVEHAANSEQGHVTMTHSCPSHMEQMDNSHFISGAQTEPESTTSVVYDIEYDDDFIHCDVAEFSEDSEGDLVDDLDMTTVPPSELDTTVTGQHDDRPYVPPLQLPADVDEEDDDDRPQTADDDALCQGGSQTTHTEQQRTLDADSDCDSLSQSLYTDSLPSPSTHILLVTPEDSPIAPPLLTNQDHTERFHEHCRSITPLHMDFTEARTDVKVSFV